jgi:hypothetical protein
MTSFKLPPLPHEDGGHAWVKENYAAYLAGGLDAKESALVEQHLAACAECAAFADEMKGMESALAAMFTDARMDGIEDRIINNLRENAVKKNARFVLAKRVGLGIAAALVLGATGVMADYAVRHDLLGSNKSAPKKPVQIAVIDASGSIQSRISKSENGATELTSKVAELAAINQTQSNVISSLKNQYTQHSESLTKTNTDALKFLNRSEEMNRENDKLRQENTQLTKALRMTNERLLETEQKYDAMKNAPATDGPAVAWRDRSVTENLKGTGGSGFVGGLDLTNNDEIWEYGDPTSGVRQNQLALKIERQAGRVTGGDNVDLLKVGTGKSTLSGDNSYGGTTLDTNGDTLRLGAGGALGTNAVPLASGSTLDVGGFDYREGQNRAEQAATDGIVVLNENAPEVVANRFRIAKLNIGNGDPGAIVKLPITESSPTSKGDAYFLQAEKTARDGDFAKAQEMYKQALDKDPNNAAAKAGLKLAQDSLEYRKFQAKNQGKDSASLPGYVAMNVDGKKEEKKVAGFDLFMFADSDGKQVTERALRSVTEAGKQIPDDMAMVHLVDKPIRLSNTVAATQASTPATVPANGASQPDRRLTAEQIQARKIIRNGTVEYEVRNFDDTQATVMRLVEEEGGFVASTNSDRLANGKMKGVIVVRVPPDRLDTLVLKLRGIGELKAQQIGSSDVSKQYTDMESKLRALKVMEARLIEIIKTGNGDVKQLVEAETRLSENRQQMEQIVGELRYYDNLVAMATLTVSAYEKDIRQAAAVVETERSDIGIETEDVEARYTTARKIIDDAKGRIVSSALKRLEGDQVNATIVCRVAQDAAGLVVDQLRQLGRVSRYTRDKVLQSDPNVSAAAATVKTELRDAEIQISLYNLANVPPRETTYITVAVPDVQEMFGKIQEAVRQNVTTEKDNGKLGEANAAPAGKVINSSLTGQKPEQMSATIQANVRAADFARVMELIKKGGGVTEEVLSASVVTSSDIAGTTLEKKGIQLTLQSTASVWPRETFILNVAATSVKNLRDEIKKLDAAGKVRIMGDTFNEPNARDVNAGIRLQIPQEEMRTIDALFASPGVAEMTRTAQRSEDTNRTSRKVAYEISIISAEALPPIRDNYVKVEVAKVKEAMEALRVTATKTNSRELDSRSERGDDGSENGRMVFDSPVIATTEVLEKARSMGDIKGSTVQKVSSLTETALSRDRVRVEFVSKPPIASGSKLSGTIYNSLDNAITILVIVLGWLLMGAIVLTPVAIVAWIVRKLWRRRKVAAPV